MKTKARLAFFLIVLFQVLVLVGMIAFNEAALASGRTVILQTGPVDPFDIFRGDYVQLRYEITIVRDIPGVFEVKPGDTVYVRLEPQGGVWGAVEVTNDRREADNWDLFIKGNVDYSFDSQANIEYGIEQYFVPQGEGIPIQNAGDIKVQVKISSSGTAVIEHLIVDGKVLKFN